MAEQTQAWRQASDLRGYAAAVQAGAEKAAGENGRQRLASWAEWAGQEADRLDPVCDPDVLGFAIPGQIAPAALDEYMPVGMTVRYLPATPPRP